MSERPEVLLLNSNDWCEWHGIKPGQIADPDGWDRKNFTQSWDEEITCAEFRGRVSGSSVSLLDSVMYIAMMPIPVYVGGAYSADNVMGVASNIRRGRELGAQVLAAGFAPYVPWNDWELCVRHEYERVSPLQGASMTWLGTCRAMIVVPEGLENSKGTQAEMRHAKALGIPIFYDLWSLICYFGMENQRGNQKHGPKINHPTHYNMGNLEVIDVIEDWGLDFNMGNALKYIARAPFKGSEDTDRRKAVWYLKRAEKHGTNMGPDTKWEISPTAVAGDWPHVERAVIEAIFDGHPKRALEAYNG